MEQAAITFSLVLCILAACPQSGLAQTKNADIAEPMSSSAYLPDAPQPQSAVDDDANGLGSFKPPASIYASTIEPDFKAQHLTMAGKVKLAGSELFSIQFPVSAIVAAGISHGLNSDPNYGKNSEAFAKRVGAAGARESSQIVFSDAILAPLLHQDPRYYVKGSGNRVLTRAAYAVSRIFISRTDSGHATINFADLAGYGGSAALTQLYYPSNGRNRDTMLSTYGSSLGGLAIHNELYEFVRFLNLGQRK